MTWDKLLKDQRKQKIKLIKSTLKEANTKAEAARLLGISRQQMHTLLKMYEITHEK